MKTKRIAGNDLSSGSIPKHMIKFALPMLAGLLFNMGYSIVNMVWIGNLLGKAAMGAAAVSLSINLILIGVLSGSTMAMSILVSRYYGSKNFDMVRKVIDNSWYLFSASAALLTISGILLRKGLLQMVGTPAGLLDMASDYLAISLLSFFISYIYQIIASSLSGMGDTRTPVIFSMIMTCVNAGLDPILISKYGLNGAACASLISWLIAMLAAAIYLKNKKPDISLVPKGINPDKKMILEILKVGLPTTVKSCLTPISLMFMTALVNGFGADAISAYGAAGKVDYLAIMPGLALGAAASVMTGQNIGAGKTARVKQVLKWGIAISFSVLCIVAATIEIFPKQILSIFADDPQVLSIGLSYLRINAIGYCIFSISYITDGFINGHRKTMITMANAIISLIAVRIPLAIIMSKAASGITGIWYAMLITYAIPSLCGLLYCKRLIRRQSSSGISLPGTISAGGSPGK